MTRYPSNLISCSQPGPDGGLSASAGWHGRMKPAGLHRGRIGRETRQSMLGRHVTAAAAQSANQDGRRKDPQTWSVIVWRREGWKTTVRLIQRTGGAPKG